MISIEYRCGDVAKKELRRDTTEMKEYLSRLVDEILSADIPAEFLFTEMKEKKEENKVLINGIDVRDILKNTKIIIPETDEECDTDPFAPKLVKIGRPVLQWNERFIEDIPDILMKNAISKVYSETE